MTTNRRLGSLPAPAHADRPVASADPWRDAVADRSAADFRGGSTDAGAYVSDAGGGEVLLAPTVAADFAGADLPPGWFATAWEDGGAVTLGGGVVTLDGARVGGESLFGSGRSLEFEATFSGDAYQHVGLGTDLATVPWVTFSTRYGKNLYARSNFYEGMDSRLSGQWLGGPHRFRIDWNHLDLVFWIDGEQVAHQLVPVVGLMRPVAGAKRVGRGIVEVAWMRLSPYAASGTFVSRVFDAGRPVTWSTVAWTAERPPGTTVSLAVRAGDSATPDGGWTSWTTLDAPGARFDATSRFVQYRAELATASPRHSPALREVRLSYSARPRNTRERAPLLEPTGQVHHDMSSDDADVTVYFNPACSKCRTASGILAERGVDADYVEYLDRAPGREELERLMRLLGIDHPGQMMRTREPLYRELGLEAADRDELLDALAAHPVLLERPIVVRGDRAVIARPPERVLELL